MNSHRLGCSSSCDEEGSSCCWRPLSDDAVSKILGFLGPQEYRFLAGTNRQFQRVYQCLHHDSQETSLKSVVESMARCQIYVKEKEGKHHDRNINANQQEEDEEAATTKTTSRKRSWQQIAKVAALYGSLEVFKEAFQQGGCDDATRDRAMSHEFYVNATIGGNLPILKWVWTTTTIHVNTTPNNSNATITFLPYEVHDLAAYHGHLHILKWSYSVHKGFICGWNGTVCANAAGQGHLDVLKWARQHNYHWNAATCANAAQNGHLHVLQWARENNCPWDSKTNMRAIKGGHLHILKWARTHSCPWSVVNTSSNNGNGLTNPCRLAARHGHLEILQWLRETVGCDWNAETCAVAAANGHFHVLKWARHNGCDWDSRTCALAAKNGHLQMLQWSRQEGCEWDLWTCHYAAMEGHLNVLQWAVAQGCEWDIERICAFAELGGHLDILKWALQYRSATSVCC